MPKQKRTPKKNDMIGENNRNIFSVNVKLCASEMIDVMDRIKWKGPGSYRRALKFIGIEPGSNSIYEFYKNKTTCKKF